MRLHVADLGWFHPGAGQRLANHRLLRPSWLTAEPRIRARMVSSAARASERRLSTTIPQPSPRTKPLARASNVLQRPSGASAPTSERPINASGIKITFTPPARARLLCPVRKLWQARCTAVSDEEQAVSTAMHGPCRPNV